MKSTYASILLHHKFLPNADKLSNNMISVKFYAFTNILMEDLKLKLKTHG